MQPSQTPAQPVNRDPFVKPQGRNKKKLAAIIAVAVAIVVLGSGSSYAYMTYQKPQNVMSHAMFNLLRADTVQTTTVVDVDTTNQSALAGVEFKNITIETKTSQYKNAQLTAKATIVIEKKDYDVSGDVRLVESGEIYFRIDAEDAFVAEASQQASAIDASINAGQVRDVIQQLLNTWVKVGTDSIESVKEDRSCTTQIFEAIRSSDEPEKQLRELYDKKPFINSVESTDERDGYPGYKIVIDNAKFEDYLSDSNTPQFVRDIEACNEDEETEATPLYPDEPSDDGDTATISMWVSPWTHQLQALSIEATSTDESSDTKTTSSAITEFVIDGPVDVGVPDQSKTFEEWRKPLRDFITKASAASEASYDSQVGQQQASIVSKKAEAYNAIESKYPTYDELISQSSGPIEARLDADQLAVMSRAAPSASNPTDVYYEQCTASGARTGYYDAVSQSTKYVTLGSGCIVNRT